MKSIRTFIEGKIRRTESGEILSLETEGEAHGELGALEGCLVGPKGRVRFFEHGMQLADDTTLRYDAIARVMLSPVDEGERFVDIVQESGTTTRMCSSPLGGEVVHATLRWIGNALLRRRIAD